MLIPIGDEPNDPRRVPWMNYALIGLNVLVFLWMKVQASGPHGYDQLIIKYGYKPADGAVATIFTSMFMHAGFLHLGGNMLFLWIFGDNVEARLGSLGYLVAYLAVGVAATLIFGAFNADSMIPCVGASGAISGVQGLYFIACPRHKVKVFVWFYFFITVLHVNARWIIGFWFVLQDLLPTLLRVNVGMGGVAHMAHLGGFVSGLALMLVLRPLVKSIERAAASELGRTQRYVGGRASSQRYERTRRRDPYVPPRRRSYDDDDV